MFPVIRQLLYEIFLILFLPVEDRIELPRKTQYTLRHAFDTKAMKRLPMETVNLLMGHTVYERTYDHRSGEELLRQVNEVRDKMFS